MYRQSDLIGTGSVQSRGLGHCRRICRRWLRHDTCRVCGGSKLAGPRRRLRQGLCVLRQSNGWRRRRPVDRRCRLSGAGRARRGLNVVGDGLLCGRRVRRRASGMRSRRSGIPAEDAVRRRRPLHECDGRRVGGDQAWARDVMADKSFRAARGRRDWHRRRHRHRHRRNETRICHQKRRSRWRFRRGRTCRLAGRGLTCRGENRRFPHGGCRGFRGGRGVPGLYASRRAGRRVTRHRALHLF